ncbi:TIGR03915 family putative DNA repair protein [Acetobacter sp. AN02]|uniref:TIGR03915 family putative DNA repair protein n=1 Tax=Acetobacter sp. AN02 TaxID=2894186 RepID=UPI0024343ED2|nr:TIGR03915 family putative DNA repair protein [Acetobacter sp. AN02]MDG6094074.1 TIGR03915 family putative DNA repair protein [Acetobacter sp. AN02]
MTPEEPRHDRLHTVTITCPDDPQEWRDKARRLAAAEIPPGMIRWTETDETATDLFGTYCETTDIPPARRTVRASRAFLHLAGSVLLHRDRARFPALYRLLWRLQGAPHLMENRGDPDVHRLMIMAGQVRRDIHKMRAFVRFRHIGTPDGEERYIAWFEPDHHIVRANSSFFINRFASQNWSILTPDLCLHWNGTELSETAGARKSDAPAEDATEELWQRYYASIFNPARLKISMMVREMPRRYWKNLPEARLIPELIAGAQAREAAMVETGADPFPGPPPETLQEIAAGIATCRACPIGCNGTAAVAGQGPEKARLLIVDEQPGEAELSQGSPQTGHAAQIRSRLFPHSRITYAIKHFKFTQNGNFRLPKPADARETDICRRWLNAERRIIRPDIILALGPRAGRAILGRTPSLERERGQFIPLPDGSRLILTAHPASFNALSPESRQKAEEKLQNDLDLIPQDCLQPAPEPGLSAE